MGTFDGESQRPYASDVGTIRIVLWSTIIAMVFVDSLRVG
jgi:hypothetical protein